MSISFTVQIFRAHLRTELRIRRIAKSLKNQIKLSVFDNILLEILSVTFISPYIESGCVFHGDTF